MTSLSRRSVLKGAAALGGTSLFSASSFADSSLPVLRAAPASAQLAPDGYCHVWTAPFMQGLI